MIMLESRRRPSSLYTGLLGALAITTMLGACDARLSPTNQGAAAIVEPEPAADWQVAGRLGILQFVIVPETHVADFGWYERAVAALCEPGATCFMRFYANSQGLPVTMPLSDAILAHATAFYQRSAKQDNAVFQWACRMNIDTAPECF